MIANEFDFNANRGLMVEVTTESQTNRGSLLGIIPGDIVIIKFPTKQGILGICEFIYSEIKDIRLLKPKSNENTKPKTIRKN